MLKLAGGLILLFSTTAIGIGLSRRLRARVRNLRGLRSAIELMRGEILTRNIPIPELLEQLADELDGPPGKLFRSAAAKTGTLGDRSFMRIWREALAETPELQLTEDELSVLQNLGYILGRYSSQEQAAILDFAARRFDAFLEEATRQREKKGPVSVAIGLASGLLVMILFL